MKKIITILLGFLSITTTVFALNPNDYINWSLPNNTQTNKIISYIDSQKRVGEGAVFCVGKDKIHYFESFFDEERDYYNLPFSEKLKGNSSINEYNKQPNPNGIEIMLEHNPSVYQNPVTISNISKQTYSGKIMWDGKLNKWRFSDKTDSILFTVPTDSHRGEWTITLKAKDFTGKSAYDQLGEVKAIFRVHKAPIPKITRTSLTQTATSATLTDGGSYDLDGQYKGGAQKYNETKGIKQYYWSVKINGEWRDVGKGKTITFPKIGLITDFRLTVEDFDGAFGSISQNSLIIEKPTVDFEFLVGGKTTHYAYKGNIGKESLSVNGMISWNDEAYDPGMYGTSNGLGTQTERWTALHTSDAVTGIVPPSLANKFSINILKNNFNNIIINNTIPVELQVKNKFNYVDSKQKVASVYTVQTQDKTGTEGYVHLPGTCTINPCGFMVGTQARFILNQTNSMVNNEEIWASVTSSLGTYNLVRDGGKFTVNVPLPDNSNYWDSLNYTFNIYSKRTNELLHRVNGTSYIHTPLNLEGKVEGKREGIEINADEPFTISATTTKYAKQVKVELRNATTNALLKTIQLAPNSAHTSWESEVVLDSNTIVDETNVRVDFTAVAYNNRDIEHDTLTMKAIAYKLYNFRVVKVKDYQLEGFYKSGTDFVDKPMNVNSMGIDYLSFYPYPITSLKKGYIFEFEIDSMNFNAPNDTIAISPSFFAAINDYRDPEEKDGYWIDNNKQILKIGQGAHSKYNRILLTADNRKITGGNKATWRGQYFIPATSFLVPKGTTQQNAKSSNLKSDIIVNFDIKGNKNGIVKFDYNKKQWGLERTNEKLPYKIGDVIRYGLKSNLDDLNVIRPR